LPRRNRLYRDYILLARLQGALRLRSFPKVAPAPAGAINPLSAASVASLRIADILIRMDDEPSPRASSDTRQASNGGLGEAGARSLLKPAKELAQRHVVHARVMGEETLSSTSVFNFCHCAIFSTTNKSFIYSPVIGVIGGQRHENITSVRGEHQRGR